MEPQLLEIEGTWEQIAALAPGFAGRRLRLIVLPQVPEHAGTPADALSIEEKIAAIVADVPEEDWARLPPDLSDQLDHYIYGTPKR
jgi:hypothetical protein